jgi:chromosome segregation ATPase
MSGSNLKHMNVRELEAEIARLKASSLRRAASIKEIKKHIERNEKHIQNHKNHINGEIERAKLAHKYIFELQAADRRVSHLPYKSTHKFNGGMSEAFIDNLLCKGVV